MVSISEVDIISIDKSQDSWEIEGEVMFDENFSSLFSVIYLPHEDELENLALELDIDMDDHDLKELKENIIDAVNDFDQE